MFYQLTLILKGVLCSYFLLACGTASAQKPCTTFQLQGKINNAEGQWLYIKSYDYKTYQLQDSIQVKNGVIATTLFFDEPTVLLLACKDQRAMPLVNCGSNAFTWDISKPGSFLMKDNGVSKDFADLHEQLNRLDLQMIELSKQGWALEHNKQSQDSVWALKNNVQNTYPIVIADFMREQPNSFTSLYLLRGSTTYSHIDTVKAFYSRLNKKLKAFPSAKAVQAFIELEKKLLPLSELTFASGKNGVAGYKYYVVDFWGSWCGPCIASIPAIKKLYNEYQPRNIQFVSLAYEKKNIESYKQALETHQMPWPQAYLVKLGEERTLIDDYYITAFPTYFILDSEYRIRHRIIGSHEELAETLKKL